MILRKKLLRASKLYFILDKNVSPNSAALLNKLKNKSLGIIQFRDKLSSKKSILRKVERIKKKLSELANLFIINDHPYIARKVNADGVHLGQGETSLSKARKILGNDKIIGISCHSLNQALNAENSGADYISIGPIYKTKIKPEYRPRGPKIIKQIYKRINIPFFAIGGINLKNLDEVMQAGCNRIAVCSLIGKSKNPSRIISKINKKLKK